LLCDDVFCCNAEHIAGLSQFADHITAACLKSAAECIPSTKPCGASGHIPGFTEHVAPLRSQSLFWHRLWQDCGKPHSGIVADIMRRSRARYHAAVRQIRRQQADIVNDRIAAALAENSNRNFWDEIKCIRQNKRNTVGVVDGLCVSSDIANLFAGKYRELYISVQYDLADMQGIRDDLTESLANDRTVSSKCVGAADVLHAITD